MLGWFVTIIILPVHNVSVIVHGIFFQHNLQLSGNFMFTLYIKVLSSYEEEGKRKAIFSDITIFKVFSALN